jgi:hypothetical protein
MALSNQIPAPKEPQKADCPSASCCASFAPIHPKRLNDPLERELRGAWEALSAKDQNRILAGPECAIGEIPDGQPYEVNLLTGGYQPYPYGEMTDRDRMVAAEVIQWLGSPIGMNFLASAFRKAGGKVEFDSFRHNAPSLQPGTPERSEP